MQKTTIKPEAATTPRRGRPPDPAKHQAIIDATRALFFAGSTKALSIEGIARAAGVSKVTVYAHFGDLQGLVRATVLAQRAEMTAILDQLPTDAPGLRRTLIEFGGVLMEFLSSEGFVTMHRMVASQASQQPWLGPLIYREGPTATRDKLADILAEAVRRGDLRAHDCTLAAEQLLGMWQGLQTTGLFSGGCPRADAATLARRIEQGVEVLLRAYAPEPAD
ncbi:TetR/AcrR family transcriptional regulator [Marichromatium gracile]|uniref:TetR/AcrR family transcriptional regulator n=1 Tax=Marichromatium gracile TaxID=1048 RepID=UPI001F1B73AC|nr:TetR/AcrR family transcriptional regulator [Marichromatium gracile]MCF1182065.1 TetR/AcrR family transcriptional regulator [Marichromatium gracile]